MSAEARAGAVRGMASAFPITPGDERAVSIEVSQGNRYGSAGLTIREEFAGRAMAAIVAGPMGLHDAMAAQANRSFEQAVACLAVSLADALLEELAK